MPRGRKPAAAKMSAPKKEEVITLTKEQFETLRKVSELLGDARISIHRIEDCESMATMAFAAGKAFVATNEAEDIIDNLIREIDPIKDEDDWDDDDEDEDY